jgi:hypothetical protein
MKTINIANSTYGALWLRAVESDKTEDDILRRLLGIDGDAEFHAGQEVGFHDTRFDVIFSEGFRIYRTYKGDDFEAIATKGKWRLNGKFYDSLNKLNGAVGASTENAWISWFFDRDGIKTPISDLREPKLIVRRI